MTRSGRPTRRRLAFGAATAPDADLAPRVPLYTIDVSGGFAKPELVALADGIGTPTAWTPDGSALIVVGTPSVPFGHLRLLRVPLDPGRAVTDLAGSLDRNVMPGGPGYPGGLPTLTDGGATVVFCVRDRGCTHVYAAAADGSGTPKPVVAGAGRVVSGLSVSSRPREPGGTAAVALATPDSYGEIVVVDLASGAETVITTHGAGQAEVELYARQEREFTISDGTTVPGWLIRDPDAAGPARCCSTFTAGRTTRGTGPPTRRTCTTRSSPPAAGRCCCSTPAPATATARRSTPPRVGGWGTADAADFLEPIDALVAEGIADPARLAVTGYSYGGYMTCYLTSRDGRFAAAVAGRRGQRPDQHDRHLGRGQRARRTGSSGSRPRPPTGPRSPRCRRSPGSPT